MAHNQIFVNLPVKDLNRTKEFFGKLGFSFNPQFTDENAACMVVSESIFVMLLVEPFFQTFISKSIVDAKTSTEVLVALSCESRQEVEDVIKKAVDAGATLPRASQDHGFMFQHAFEDLDGHIWELVWMDPSAVEPS